MKSLSFLAFRTVFLIALSIFAAAILSGCGGGGSGGSSGETGGAASGGAGTTSGGERVTVGDTEALVWGDGDRGVVLSHGAAYDAASWTTQAEKIAGAGATVLAVEDTSAENIQAAVDYLEDERGVQGVSLIGASAGSAGVLDVGRQSPEEVAQIILLSGTGEVSGLGDFPKLFTASESEGLADQVRQMAEEAPGDRNEALIVDSPQGDRLLQAITERLSQYG
jgi:pimeloyl-ACP methyl ester carboxylesterase